MVEATAWHEKCGRPPLAVTENAKERILEIIQENMVCYPGQIAMLYGKKHRAGQPISWRTVRKYLDQLKEEHRIFETILNKGVKRTTSQVRVSEHLD